MDKEFDCILYLFHTAFVLEKFSIWNIFLGNEKIIEEIMKHGAIADPESVDGKMPSPLYIAICKGIFNLKICHDRHEN